MQVLCQPVGPLEANCYIVLENGKALIIDPGADAPLLKGMIGALGAEVQGILLTHGHFDHIGAADALCTEFQAPVYMNPTEYASISASNADFPQARNVGLAVQPKELKEGQQKIGDFEVNAWYAPGHSAGSTIIQIGDCLFTGDVLFQDSIGRTDLQGGSVAQMKASLEYLKSLKGNFEVYPGHGPSTTLDYEKQHNVFLLHTNLLR